MPNSERGSKIDLYGLDVGIAIVEDGIRRARSDDRNDLLVQAIFAELSSDTRLLETTEWDSGVEGVIAINPNSPCFQFVCSIDRPVDIFAKDGGSKPID